MDVQRLLADIEMDVQELKFLVDAFSKNPDEVARRIVKRDVERVQGRLTDLLKEIEKVSENQPETYPVVETVAPLVIETIIPTVIEPVTPALTEACPQEQEGASASLVETTPPEIRLQTDALADSSDVSHPLPSSTILAERIRPATDLKRSISLNDSFRFSRELFDGSTERMNTVLQQITVLSSLDEALTFLSGEVNVPEDNEALNDLQELLKKFFN